MANVTDFKITQTSTLIQATFSDDKKTKNGKGVSEAISTYAKTDIIDISAQIEIISKSTNKNTDYQALEKKLGIDSSKWGVEAVSDDIFNFAKAMYERYKLNHKGEEDKSVLDGFYNMAKSSITKGYNEAKNFLGAMPDDVANLAEGTFNRSLEKLDEWYKNGGVEKEETEETPEAEEVNVSEETETNTKAEPKGIDTEYLLKESEELKNSILEMLKQQGIYFNEQQTKKASFDIKG